MNMTKKVLFATLALSLAAAMPVSAAVCTSGSKASDCPASTAHKSDHKKDEKQAPAAVGTTVHSEGTADLGSASNHEHGVEVKVKEHKTESMANVPSTPDVKVKEHKTDSTASAPSIPDVKVKEQKTESMASVPTNTPQMPIAVDSHVKLHKYHETQQHEVHVVEHGAPTARSLPVSSALPAPPASGAQTITGYFVMNQQGHMVPVGPLSVAQYKSVGWINPDGTVSEAGVRRGIVPVVAPQTPQLAAQVPQSTPTPDPVKHPLLQTSANPPATTPADFKYLQNGVGIHTRVVQNMIDSGYIRPDGSLTSRGRNHGLVAEPFQTNPTPHLATTTGPTPTPTPNEIKAPPLAQAQQPLGAGKSSKTPTPTPDPINAPQMVQTSPAVPQQVAQTTPATALRPADHSAPGISYFITDSAGNLHPVGTADMQTNPRFTNPDGTLTPFALEKGFTSQFQQPTLQGATQLQQPLGAGKSSKNPVPTPNTINAPQMGHTIDAVPPQPAWMQVPQQTPQVVVPPRPSEVTLRPVDHLIPGITYTFVDRHGVEHQVPSSTLQKDPVLTNPDGTLTPTAIAKGWTMTMATPQMVPQPQATPNLQTPPQNPPQQQVPVATTVQAPNMVPQPQATPNLQTPPQNPPLQQVPVAMTVQAPNMAPQPQATPNLQTPPQNPPQQQVPVAMTVQAPNMAPPQPGQTQVPSTAQQVATTGTVPTQPGQPSVATVTHSLHPVQKTNKPPQPTRPTSQEALAGTPAVARPHGDHLVETYHPVKTGVYRYEEARQMKDDSFHLMVLGFREPN